MQPEQTAVSMLDHALAYAARGWRVFPVYEARARGTQCACGKKTCTSPAKHPRTPNGCKDASSDADQIKQWWRRWPDASIGIATGAGLAVVDIDPGHGGNDTMEDLRRALGRLPDSVEVITGGGGRHIYLSVEPGTPIRCSVGQLGAGVDIRGDGGYVVAPPSMHVSGRRYAWESSSDPSEGVEVASLPATWLEKIRRPALRVVSSTGPDAAPILEGGRNASLFSLARSMRAKGLSEAAVTAALHAENEVRCVPPLDTREVDTIARSACSVPAGLSPEYEARRRPALPPPPPADDAPDPDGPDGVDLPADPDDWKIGLATNSQGRFKKSYATTCAVLRHAPEWTGRLAWNEMAGAPCIFEKAGDRTFRTVVDADIARARESIEIQWGFDPGAEALWSAVLLAAQERRFHPVRDVLRGLTWDGTPRIDRVATEILRSTDPHAALMLRRWFVSLVARILDPGCKVDTALVFVGAQGARKSSFFDVIAGRYFCDSHADITSKDIYLQLAESWVFELAEIDGITTRRHADEIKAFLSSRNDRYRPPYGRAVVTVPRHCVIVGTTNQTTFLEDDTGSRRFWCVNVGAVDLELAREWREQLLAEAVHLFECVEPWWLDRAEDAEREAGAEQHQVEDPWAGAVRRWLGAQARNDHTSEEILTGALDMLRKDQTKAAAMRVAKLLRGIRNADGSPAWERRCERPLRDGVRLDRTWVWCRTQPAQTGADW